MTGTSWRDLGLVAVAVGLALVVLHPEAALQGKIYTSDDARASAAFSEAGAQAQRQGDNVLWNPFVFGGMPAFGSLGYTADAYPLRKPLRWLTWTVGLPPLTWLLFHLFIFGFTSALYLRWRGLSLAAAIVGGVLVMSLPKLAAWSAYGHGTKVGTLAWLPLAMWSAEAFLRGGRWPWLFVLGISVALQLLRAHVQIAYYSVMILAIGAVFLVLPGLADAARRRATLGRVTAVAAVGVLALGAAMVLYLPVLEYQGQSIRGGGSASGGAAYDYATGWSLPWSELATFWWPTAVGYGKATYVGGMPFTDYPNYVGGILLGLAVLGIWLRPSRWKWSLLCIVGLATLLALGKHGPLYQFFYDVVPGFKKFRVPVMVLILQELAVVFLAVSGLDELMRRARGDDRPAWLGPPGIAAVAVAGAMLLAMGTVGAQSMRNQNIDDWQARSAERIGQPSGLPATLFAPTADLAVRDAVRLGLLLVGLSGLVLLVYRRRLPAGAAVALLGAGLYYDYWSVTQPLLHPDRHLDRLVRQGEGVALVDEPALVQEHAAVAEMLPVTDVSEFLTAQEDRPRVYPWPSGPWAVTNELAGQGIVCLGGYHAAKLRVYEDIRARLFDQRPPEVRLANMMAARYVVVYRNRFSDDSLDQLDEMGLRLNREPLFLSPQGTVYRNESAAPRAWIVPTYELEVAGRNTAQELPDPSMLDRVLAMDLRQRAILSAEPNPRPAPGAEAGSVQITEEGYTWVKMNAQLPVPGVLVMADVFYPGWDVWIDGEPGDLLRANHALRGVPLPAGEHEIEFRFSAQSFRTGRAISRVSGALLMIGLVGSLGWQWRRRSEA